MGNQRSQLIEAASQGQVAGARGSHADSTDADERSARRTLRAQIGRLERELAGAFVTAYEIRAHPLAQPLAPASAQPLAPASAQPRLLDLGELEVVRDDLIERLHDARVTITRRADEQAENRVLLERMRLQPGRYRFARVSCHDLGEPGCGVWQVRPKLGLIGMLMGWWQVKLSSGCPLAGGRVPARWPARP